MADEQVIVDRDDVRVMFRRAADEQDAITRAWAEVEGAVRSLKGRRFYGVFDPATSEYRACVQWRDGDDAAALGLEEGTLQGGPGTPERVSRVSLRLSTVSSSPRSRGSPSGRIGTRPAPRSSTTAAAI